MNNDVDIEQNNTVTNTVTNTETNGANSARAELSEDMIVVSPGQILSEARKKLLLSPEQIADKLNFRVHLVTNIEQDIFDRNLPATFNRGYLRNYAKLVGVDVDEVLAAYDLLGAAEVQRSEMQSFSNLTVKQVEHSRLMWLSYLIAAILFGLMVVWWLQAPSDNTAQNVVSLDKTITTAVPAKNEAPLFATEKNSLLNQVAKVASESTDNSIEESVMAEVIESAVTTNDNVADVNSAAKQAQSVTPIVDTVASTLATTTTATTATTATEAVPVLSIDTLVSTEMLVPELAQAEAVFTFSGDCWVNIYDATGERIAWGVKKSGYVMNISGQSPLTVTLGKPELATIMLNGQPVDMTGFSSGNIAKFTLPLNL